MSSISASSPSTTWSTSTSPGLESDLELASPCFLEHGGDLLPQFLPRLVKAVAEISELPELCTTEKPPLFLPRHGPQTEKYLRCFHEVLAGGVSHGLRDLLHYYGALGSLSGAHCGNPAEEVAIGLRSLVRSA
jgi:hypothetical protein